MDAAIPDVATNSRDLIVAINVKTERLISDVKDLRTDTFTRITNLESWKAKVDEYHASINLKRYNDIADWTERFRDNFKLIILVGMVIVGVVEAFVGEIIRNWFHI